MDYNMYNYTPNEPEATIRERSSAFPALMSKVYLWMTLALAITGLTAYYVAGNEQLLFSIASNQAVFWGLIIGELALVWILSANINRLSFPVAGLMFGAYSMESIATTFFVTAGTFGAMSLLGLFIKRDLSGVGRFLIMGLFGLIIASVVNMFVASSTLSWAVSYVGVFIFCGLTAYDTQKMKEILQRSEGMGQTNMLKIALLCSLSLYLDFINLFLYLLRFFGNSRN